VLRRYCSPDISPTQLARLLHREDTPTGKLGKQSAMKEAVLKKLRADYPKMLAQKPDLPSLEEMLVQAERRFADQPVSRAGAEPPSIKSFFLAENRADELAKYLGIAEGVAVNSYRYLKAGDGTIETLLLVEADGVRPVRLTSSL
jgi:hypothetical protein